MAMVKSRTLTWTVGVVSAVIAGLLPIADVAALTNIGILSAFVVLCIAVIVLRRTRPTSSAGSAAPGCRGCRGCR